MDSANTAVENLVKVLLGGVTYIRFYFISLCKALLIPVLAIMVLNSIALAFPYARTVVLLVGVLEWIPYTLIAITTHKIIIEGSGAVPTWGINRFKWRELKFLLYEILAIVLFVLPTTLALSIPYIGILIFVICVSFFVGRISLVFPSTAVGSNINFSESWIATKEHKLMMSFVAILLPLFLELIGILLSLGPRLFHVASFFTILATVFCISTLSVAYKIVIGDEISG